MQETNCCMTYKSNFQVADQCSITNSHYSATIVAILDGLLQSHNCIRINIEQRGWDSEAIEKNGQKERLFTKIFVKVGAGCGWKKDSTTKKKTHWKWSQFLEWTNYTGVVLVHKFRPYLGICKLTQDIEMGNSKTAICHLRGKDQPFPTHYSIYFL